MKRSIAQVDSVCLGMSEHDLDKDACQSLDAQLSGFIGDRHGSFERETWSGGDKQVEGTIRRNERQWSAVSTEELAEITLAMDLKEPLTAGSLGANLRFSWAPNKGSILRFPSGAELMVEEYNPPCLAMGEKLAAIHRTNSGIKLLDRAFSMAAKCRRGVVGVIEVPGIINAGDEVAVIPYRSPTWLGKV